MKRLLLIVVIGALVFVGCSATKENLGTLMIVSGVKDTASILSELIEFRREQGWTVIIAEVEDANTETIQQHIREEASNNDRLSHILLVGSDESIPFGRRELYRTQRAEHELPVLTDDVYALCDETGVPQLAVGRFPSENPEELRGIAVKTLAYEKAIGSLKQEVFILCGRELAGGEAIMGFITPQQIADNMSNTFLKGFHGVVSPTVSVNAKTAFPGPDHFPNEKTIETFTEGLQSGPLMSVFAGHANRRAFALQHEPGQREWLDRSGLSNMKLDAISGPFYTGGCSVMEPKKGGKPSIGRTLLQLKGGPVAVAGFTRINDDFIVMQCFEILANEITQSEHKTFGGLIQTLKKRILTETQSDRSKTLQFFMNTSGKLVQNAEFDYQKTVKKNAALLTIYGDPTVSLMFPKPALSE